MVDVGAKTATRRVAVAAATVLAKPSTIRAIRAGRVEKGAVLETARLAGIQAAKRTSDLIPLCHPLSLTKVSVDFEVGRTIEIAARAEAVDRTGVEMEALTAASIAALTIYDMCKALDRGMEITRIRLLEKSGGKSGRFVREEKP
ncbi:MAG: cyclic pyranopterin monophosphate synthase MoaC [Planctomycetes bacterium]|nr:cyclic pyranopterin monophosphate synthase MoaC [Planctomycetota bacterium]